MLLNTTTEVLLYTLLFRTHIWCLKSSLCLHSVGFQVGLQLGYVHQLFSSDHTPWCWTFLPTKSCRNILRSHTRCGRKCLEPRSKVGPFVKDFFANMKHSCKMLFEQQQESFHSLHISRKNAETFIIYYINNLLNTLGRFTIDHSSSVRGDYTYYLLGA